MENTQEEIWKDVVGFEGFYQVSNLGQIKSLDRIVIDKVGAIRKFPSKTMKLTIGILGYVNVSTNMNGVKKQIRAHRIIANAFIPNPLNKPYINHINGIKHDNRIENLEWCTSSENRIHALKTGLAKSKVGVDHINAKLTNKQVLKIRELSSQGISAPKIIKEMELNVTSVSQICDIITRKAWKHI